MMRSWVLVGQVGRYLASTRTAAAGNRCVSTLSPLASAFNSKPRDKFSFNILKERSGLFGIPQLTDFTGFYLLQQEVEIRIDALLEEAVSPQRSRKVVKVFDELSDCICRVADMAEFVRASHPDTKYMRAAEDTCTKMSSLVEKLNTNVAIHGVLKQVIEHGDVVPLTAIDQRVSELFMFDFEQSGIHLDEERREKYVKLNDNIVMLGNFFMQGAQQPTSVLKASLPENVRHCFNIHGDNICVTGLYSDHYSDLVREAAYRIFLYPVPHQEELLTDLLAARRELANLVGFQTYAHRALRGTMADNPENVMSFLNTLADKVRNSASKDYRKILDMKLTDGGTQKAVMPWDPPYYTALGRHKFCQKSHQDLAPYFSLGNCMEGLSTLFRSLYDIDLQNIAVQPGETWSYDVYKLAVLHQTEGILGYIYCDFYERVGKPNQDCLYTIQGGRQKTDGTYQPPVVVLQLNIPAPQTTVPSLLSLGMMENLFHEFGHAMHAMLGRTKYQHVSGTRCPIDFAEVPSVLMEFFAYDPRVMSTFARHYKTGEKLPDNVIKNVCDTKRLYAASDIQLQVFYAALDQVYHGDSKPGMTTTEMLAEVQNQYYGIPYVDNTAWQLRFGHLVGYGARYYSYLMCRAVASRIWRQYFLDDPFSRASGERYRQEVLSHGGEKAPSELVKALLNEMPTNDILVESLIRDLDTAVS